MPVPGYDPASYGPRRVVKFKVTRTALARRGTWTSAGRGWGGSAGGARMGSGVAVRPSIRAPSLEWRVDARTLALHDALFELAMNAWD